MKQHLFLILIFGCGYCYAEMDPIKLESIFLGDKEQPAVSYFIPWQDPDSPDKLYRNIVGEHDQTLSPVDRDNMIRSLRIYNAMQLE